MLHHTSPISGVAVRGDRVATMGYDNRVILWSLADHRALAIAHHDHLANQGAFSPCGQFLATASSDHTARVYRVPDLRLLGVCSGHVDDVMMVVFDPTGARLATASNDHAVHLYDRRGGPPQQVMHGHSRQVISLSFTPDGRELVSSGDDGAVMRWDAATGRRLAVVPMDGVQTDCVVPLDDDRIAAGTDNGEIVYIDRSGAVGQRVAAHDAGIKMLLYRADQGLLISSSYDRTARLWRVNGAKAPELCAEVTLPPMVWPRSFAVTDQGDLVFATFGTTFAVWRQRTRTWDDRGLRPTHGKNAVLPDDDGWLAVGDAGEVTDHRGRVIARPGSLCNFLVRVQDRLFCGGQSGELFDARSGASLYRHRSPLNCACLPVPDGNRLLVGTYTGEGLLFEVGTGGRVVHIRTLSLCDNAVKAVAARNGVVMALSASGAATLLHAPDLTEMDRVPAAHTDIANACVATDTGFATVGRDRRLCLWDGTAPRRLDTPHTHSIKSAAWDGRFVATGSYNGRVALYHKQADRWSTLWLTTAGIPAIAAAPGGGFLAASYDGNIYRISPEGTLAGQA